jgi:hypothetical protein
MHKSEKVLLFTAMALLFLPLTLAFFGGDKFRYPCQDPVNWNKDFCKPPICDVTRTCPEHIFKGQRDPRLGPTAPEPTNAPGTSMAPQKQGVNCGK